MSRSFLYGLDISVADTDIEVTTRFYENFCLVGTLFQTLFNQFFG